MSKLILNTDCRLYELNGRAFCTSRQVAEEFSKHHYNVIRDIEELDCSPEFAALNFEVSKYKDSSGKWNKEYLISKDGFTFLAMGYRGKKAGKFKESYILRFNQMESFIKSLSAARMEFPELTEAIKSAKENPKFYHFTNEINMINKIVIGKTAKQFRIEHGIEDASSIRPYLSMDQIQAIEMLQRVDIGLLIAIKDFDQRKEVLLKYYQQSKLKRVA